MDMRALLSKFHGRSPVEVAGMLRRRAARELAVQAAWLESKGRRYRALEKLPPCSADNFRNEIERWQTGPGRFLMAYFESRIAQLTVDTSAMETLVRSADDASRGTFTLYGQRYSFGRAIDWNRDLTGKGTWPRRYQRRYRFPDTTGRRGDYRHVWELNRHQHLVKLGIAWRITGQERYVRAVVEHITSWLQQNPIFMTMNWASAMEVSLRLVSWLVAFGLISNCKALAQTDQQYLLRGMVQHQRHLLDHLSIDLKQGKGPVKLQNNHTIVELCGLLASMPFLEIVAGEAPRRDKAELQERLLDEIAMQTYADGMSVEQSSSYQRFSLEAILVTALASGEGVFRDALIEFGRVHLGVLRALKVTDTRFVLFGDEDNGHALTTHVEPKPDDSTEAGGMFGILAQDFLPASSDTTILAESGHWCWRGRLGNVPAVVYFRAGRMDFPHLPGYAPHAQCDLLSFALYLDGEPICVDSGTYSYHDIRRRNALRAGAAHNTFGIAGYDQMRVKGVFSGENYATSSLTATSPNRAVGELELPVDAGLIRLSRAVWVDEASGTICLHDRIIEAPAGDVSWYLNLRCEPDGDGVAGFYIASNLRLEVKGLPNATVEAAEYSPAYGVIEPSRRLVAVMPRLREESVSLKWSLSVMPA